MNDEEEKPVYHALTTLEVAYIIHKKWENKKPVDYV